MKVKQKPQDFRVKELLADGFLTQRGRHRVYRVTKSKLTSLEAVRTLAGLAGVSPQEVGLAGLKDRQGVTTQYMSVEGGRPVRWNGRDLRIEHIGFAPEPVSSSCSLGNAFEVTLRRLAPALRAKIEASLDEVRAHGFVNYFGDQRFGNLRFGQGWIARDLAQGKVDRALKRLLTGRSDQDDERHRAFKQLLAARWGNWRACRDIAGKFGAHHSVFEVLSKDPEDVMGAFHRVASRLRLIHLYAWQSHLWNRAVSRYVASVTPARERTFVEMLEGPLAFARGELAADPDFENAFRLPGARLEDVRHERQRELFVDVLREEGLAPEEFRIEGVGGFQLKGEDRALVVRPRRLRMHADAKDGERVTLAFELPRGAYATLLVARLAGRAVEPTGTPHDDDERPGRRGRGARERDDHDERAPERDDRRGGGDRPRPRGGPRHDHDERGRGPEAHAPRARRDGDAERAPRPSAARPKPGARRTTRRKRSTE